MAGGNGGSFPSANPVVVQTPFEEVSHQFHWKREVSSATTTDRVGHQHLCEDCDETVRLSEPMWIS
jgi:hypothetical protein